MFKLSSEYVLGEAIASHRDKVEALSRDLRLYLAITFNTAHQRQRIEAVTEKEYTGECYY